MTPAALATGVLALAASGTLLGWHVQRRQTARSRAAHAAAEADAAQRTALLGRVRQAAEAVQALLRRYPPALAEAPLHTLGLDAWWQRLHALGLAGGWPLRPAVARLALPALEALAEELGSWQAALPTRAAQLAVAVRLAQARTSLVLGERADAPEALPLALSEPERMRHTYILGKTGSGKTTLLRQLIAQDLRRDVGVIVLSPEAGLFAALRPLVPPARQADVLYLDPTDLTPPVVGFNPLAGHGDLAQRAGELHTVFTRSLGPLGPSMQTLLQHGLYALVQTPGASLPDLAGLLEVRAAAGPRAAVLAQPLDAATRAFWAAFPGNKYYHRPAEALLNRLTPLLRPPLSVCLRAATWSLAEVLNGPRPRILLLDLSRLRGVAATLLGQLLLASVQQALLQRDALPEAARRPTYLYIDEFAVFTGAGAAVGDLLERARKYGLGVTLAPQVLADLPPKLLAVLLGNVGTVVALQLAAADAPKLARELQLADLAGTLQPAVLQQLPVGQAWARTPTLPRGVPLQLAAG